MNLNKVKKNYKNGDLTLEIWRKNLKKLTLINKDLWISTNSLIMRLKRV